jgi:hypothetical protein
VIVERESVIALDSQKFHSIPKKDFILNLLVLDSESLAAEARHMVPFGAESLRCLDLVGS